MKVDLFSHSYKNPLYNSWKDMRKRCENPNRREYQWYGGKGITVCPEWQSFQQFAADMAPTWQPGLTLERKDRAQGYNKKNCTWVTLTQQQANRGNVAQHWLQLEEIKRLRASGKSQAEIGRILGMSQPSVSRLLLGNCAQL